MRKSRFTEEQILGMVRAAEGGVAVKDLCRQHGITRKTFSRWRAKYGGLSVNEARRLRQLEEENRRLKQLVADLTLDKQALHSALGKKW